LDIDGWLRSLGLGQYAAAFRDNAVDEKVLPRLTAEDLKDLGVSLVGHRRTLLDAIAALRGDANANDPLSEALPHAPGSAQASAPPPTVAPAAEAVGERRYLTVMFCDLVGSTGISARLDAEEWRDLVGAYLDAASVAVADMGGHVAKKLGDGLLVLFGYPLAQENDAERAARAALAIQRALAELNRKNAGTGKPELVARIGLEAGPVVVDSAGEIFGDAPNVAARVQALAEPGSVLITAQVQRQVAGLFVVEERGSQALKGVPEPIALYRLVRASGGGRRSGARQLTPLVGRDDEMTMLMRRWERARQGDGQLVMIVGEPGLGKSRLIEEFHGRLREVPHTWVEWSCSQLLQNTPLHPIAEWGRQRFGGADLPAERRLADLEASLAQVKLDPVENAPLLAPLLDIPLPKDRAMSVASEELRRQQLAALTNWVLAGAKVQPVVLAFEDLHWADPTTLDVLHAIAERGAQVPLYIVATTRPEFRPPWSMRSHHGTISLAPLDRAQVRDMVAELSARHALPKEVVEDVAARTGGVPLFVEEVTRLLLERGGESGIHAIPPTLQQSLMARLDRLGPAREVAQVGSVIGRGFSYALLRDVAGLEDAPLQAALEKLAEADILLVQGAPPESDYRFKHALIQDAAYENLLKSRRQVLHRRVAEILRDRFAATAVAEPEALAHHFTQAGMTDAAIEWWGKAGDQALRRSAFQEAIAHLGKAIEMADKAEEGAPRDAAAESPAGQRLKLQTSYGQALLWSRGFVAEETKAAFTRARELGASVGDSAERFTTYYGLWIGSSVSGDLALARKTAETFLSEANTEGRMTDAVIASRILGMACIWQGDFTEAKANLDQALRMYDPERDREAKFRFGLDTGVCAPMYLAIATWLLGDARRAQELAEDATARAVEFTHIPTRTNTNFFRATFEIFRGDAAAAQRTAKIMVDLSREHGLSLYLTYGAVYLAWARARLGDRETGAAELRAAVAAYSDQGNKLYMPFYQGLLAETEAHDAGVEGALSRIEEALVLAAQTGERWTDAFLHRIRGEILLKRDPANPAQAEEAFLKAIAIAQQQKARSFELRAALSLAKLYQSTNRAADAHDVLAPALEGFSPTPEFPEIAAAQALRAELAETDEVRNAAAARHRRLELQTSYANALIHARGHGAPETSAAFAKIQALAAGADNAAERFSAYYGLWVGSLNRGEPATMRETAAAFLREAEHHPDSPEAGVAQRISGLTRLYFGDYPEAKTHLEKALDILKSDRDRDLAFRFGQDQVAAAKIYLALVLWPLGEVERARELAEQAAAQAESSGNVPTLVYVKYHLCFFEAVRRDRQRALPVAESVLAVGRERSMPIWESTGRFLHGWANWPVGDRQIALTEMRRGIGPLRELGQAWHRPYLSALLAEAEADAGSPDAALAALDDILVEAASTDQRWSDAELHRIRGEILLKRDPANPKPAEEAFLTAIAIAQQQKAKGFGLRAALSLAKLYQSTGHRADAHAVLAPALEGFAPTPEFPEIAEAQTLLDALS
jgi:class 3 adenylate cyclase/predicted ATPase